MASGGFLCKKITFTSCPIMEFGTISALISKLLSKVWMSDDKANLL